MLIRRLYSGARPLCLCSCPHSHSLRVLRAVPTITSPTSHSSQWSPSPCHSRSHFSVDATLTSSAMGPSASPYFCLKDYDCVGFDLDNTLLKYNIANMVKLSYELLARFLVEQKGYDPCHLLKPLNLDFLQKGLTMDYEKGNVLQLSPDGSIHRACHGTKLLLDADIEEIYGKDKVYPLAQEYTQNMLDAWNGPISEKIRSVMDHFDVSAALAFARCVDNIDAKSENPPADYNLYNDITDGLINMYQRDNFANNTGGFFSALKENPDKYLHRCSSNVRKWLEKLKSDKKVFLVTGSNEDFASFTAKYCFGEDWKDLFDVVVFFARKPGFFTGRRPFISLVDGKESDIVQPEDVQLGKMYSQGNWQDLYELFKKETNKKFPKCVYVGDNVLQDVFAPDEFTRCDAVAISDEMRAEGVGDAKEYIDVLSSNTWGSYFYQKEDNPSLWCDIIRRHAAICVPSVDVLAERPLDFQIQTFKSISPDPSQPIGFFPSAPTK